MLTCLRNQVQIVVELEGLCFNLQHFVSIGPKTNSIVSFKPGYLEYQPGYLEVKLHYVRLHVISIHYLPYWTSVCLINYRHTIKIKVQITDV